MKMLLFTLPGKGVQPRMKLIEPQTSAITWSNFLPSLSQIELRHQADDEETPKLSVGTLIGARKFIQLQQTLNAVPPTVINGTCDATIVMEWHTFEQGKSFKSIDILGEDQAEEFTIDADGRTALRRFNF
jgi:hypothetical protein